jgi:hypothetical protein
MLSDPAPHAFGAELSPAIRRKDLFPPILGIVTREPDELGSSGNALELAIGGGLPAGPFLVGSGVRAGVTIICCETCVALALHGVAELEAVDREPLPPSGGKAFGLIGLGAALDCRVGVAPSPAATLSTRSQTAPEEREEEPARELDARDGAVECLTFRTRPLAMSANPDPSAVGVRDGNWSRCW